MNKNSVIPMYQQIAEDIKNKIQTGELKENDKLMPEGDFEKEYNVSRITVRKAISLLAEDGYVTKKQGIGTFVTAKKLHRVMTNKLLSFTEMCRAEGKEPTAEIISIEQIRANSKITKNLSSVSKGEKVIRIYRVRGCDGEGVMIEDTYLPGKYSFILEENMAGSIYEALRNKGIALEHATKTVSICYAEEKESEYLGTMENQPLLLHKDYIYNTEGEQVLYSKLIINPERYLLTINI